MTKTIGVIVLIGSIVFAVSRGLFHVYVHKTYMNEIGSNWELSERASTIAQKSEYLNKFVSALEKCKLDGVHNALFYPNDANDFTQNMKALKSLQKRLQDISVMDENSFAYQTAIQQITSQEQGEAKELLDNLESCWQKQNYYTSWNHLIIISLLIAQILLALVGYALIVED
jgi:hypothetical protein